MMNCIRLGTAGCVYDALIALPRLLQSIGGEMKNAMG